MHEKHAGTLHFETELGQGTTFFLRFPISPGAAIAQLASADAVALTEPLACSK